MLRVLTDVFPPHINPVNDGWYLTRVIGGEFWLLVKFANGYWLNDIGLPMVGRPREWRGLAFDPAAAFDHESWNWKEPGDIDSGGYEQGVFLPGAEIEWCSPHLK